MLPLPDFTPDGFLPLGDYALTLEELKVSSLVVGPTDRRRCPHWDSAWRLQLVENLAILAHQLWTVGITEIFVDGSFAEDKEHPNDIDGYFVCDLKHFVSGSLTRDLNLLDPHKIWTWDSGSRKPAPGLPHLQLPMWHKYRVELYPHTKGALSGFTDQFGNEMEFPSAFRRSRRNGKHRGIVKIERSP